MNHGLVFSSAYHTSIAVTENKPNTVSKVIVGFRSQCF